MSPTFRSRRTPTLIAAVLAGLVFGVTVVSGIGLAAGSGRLAGESDEVKALKVLRADQAALTRLTQDFSGDERLGELHAGAVVAERLAEAARQRDGDLAVLDDEAVKTNAQRAHRAITAVLSAFSELGRVTEDDLDAWDESEHDAVVALGELDAAAAPVAAMDPERPLRLDSSQIEPVVELTSTYFTTSAARLARYERRMAKFRRKNRTKLQALANYAATVEAQMGAYRVTRNQLQDYLDDAQDFGELIVDFRESLQDAKSKRQGIRSTLAAMDPPAPVESKHLKLIAVLDHAITATDLGVDLADATQRLRDSGDYETDAFELPEYDELSRQSDQITAERDAAMAEWGTAVKTYTRRLKHPKGAPSRPVI